MPSSPGLAAEFEANDHETLMNWTLPLGDALIDRIVDGGMTPDELRAAVVRLDRDPGGWKRCAVAFLEAQVLNESFRASDQPEKHEPAGRKHGDCPFAGATSFLGHRWLRTCGGGGRSSAASFAIGWIAHGTRSSAPARDSLALDDAHSAGIPPMKMAVRECRGQPSRQAIRRIKTSLSMPAEIEVRSCEPWRRSASAPKARRPRCRCWPGPGITEEWLVQQPPPVSEHGQVVLARQGYQVEQRAAFLHDRSGRRPARGCSRRSRPDPVHRQ